MRRKWEAALIALTLVFYIATIVIGLHIRNFSLLQSQYGTKFKNGMAWEAPSLSSVAFAPHSDNIRLGAHIFDETPLYAPKYTGDQVSCASCHAAGGIQPYAAPMVGLTRLFPLYNRRAGRVISLRERIQECFVRSENGKPLPYDGQEMQALVAYIGWLSMPQPDRRPFVGRGLIDLPELKPNPKHGAEVYAAQCAGCHGQNGEGLVPVFPPLWGPESFNDGAGMNDLHKMAAFVQHNMPQNRMGILSAQDAFDVSAYVHAQARPAFNPAYAHY